MLTELLVWWIGQIRDLLPAHWRAGSAVPSNALVLTIQPSPTPDPPLVLVAERRRRSETELLAFSPGALDQERLRALLRRRGRNLLVVIRVPPAWLLEREVVLPIAAADEMGRVLSYEMDRFTPFRADEVIWTFMLQARDPAQQVVRARLSLVPRVSLDQLLSLLEAAGAAPTLLECNRPDGEIRAIPIARPLTARDRRRRFAERALVLGCLALVVAVIAVPLVRQTLARADVEARIAALEPKARQAEILRARIAGALKGADVMTKEQARTGNVLEILAALTQILPDDTYLTSLRLKDQTLTIEGQSAAAAKLIPALSNNALFADPAFTGPVTRTEHGKDLFELRVSVNPPTSSR
ncbi:MAG: PilN domain-containing protein [Acetobacteraceae bacterium]|nr:PilN domain-containing protein [Acetobacteraceae bacterium]